MSGKKFANRNRSKLCHECGNLFFINKNESIRFFEFFRKYCSRKCSALVRSRILKGKPNLFLKGKTPSLRCIEASKISNSGEKSWKWKGGISKVSGYYTNKALERYARLKG